MRGDFKKRDVDGGRRSGGAVRKKASHSLRGGFSPRGGQRGGFSPRGGNRGGLTSRGGGNRGRGSFARGGGGRGGRSSWGVRRRGGHGGGNQERGRFAGYDDDDVDFKKRTSFSGVGQTDKARFLAQNSPSAGHKNKFKKSFSEPSTPAAEKLKFGTRDVEDEDDEELSVSDLEDEETTAETPSKKTAISMKEKKIPASAKDVKPLQLANGKNLQRMKGIYPKADANVRFKKTEKTSAESSEEDEDEEESEKDEDEEESEENEDEEGSEESEDEEESEENEEENEEDVTESLQKVVRDKNANGATKMDESDESEDEEEDEENLEDEDEEEAPAEEKTSVTITPGKAAPLKSALKTPGTGKSVAKKVLLSASTTATPEASKNKTPVTPYPKKVVDKSKTPTARRLKFEESDESDEDDDMEEEDEEESKLAASEKRKILGVDSLEDEDDDEEEGTDEDEEESSEDKKEDNAVVDTKARVMKEKKKVLQMHNNKQDKGAEEKIQDRVEKKISPQKQGNVAIEKEESKGVKRRFEGGPALKPEDAKDVISEEQRRREERDRKSLFVRGLPKDVKLGQLKALHDDIVYVRHMPHRNFAWLFFPNEQLCEKAFEDISKQTVEGKTLTVDFCGAKSKKRPQRDKSQLPINPLELFVGGLPPSTSRDQMKVVFRQATNIAFPKQAKTKNKLYCFVQFESEKDARAAFEKGKTLKINGVPVDVLYARVRKEVASEVKPQKSKIDAGTPSSAVSKLETKKLAKQLQVNDEDTISDEIESSDEGIEEVDESSVSRPKKAKLTKIKDPKMLRKAESLSSKKVSEHHKRSALRQKAVQQKLDGNSGKAPAMNEISLLGDGSGDEDDQEDMEEEEGDDDDKEEDEEEEEEEEDDDDDDDDDMEDSDESK